MAHLRIEPFMLPITRCPLGAFTAATVEGTEGALLTFADGELDGGS